MTINVLWIEENTGEHNRVEVWIPTFALSVIRPHACIPRGTPIVPKRKGKVGGKLSAPAG